MRSIEHHVFADDVSSPSARVVGMIRVVFFVVLITLPSCMLPLVAECGSAELEAGIARLPAQQLAVTTRDGETLRGVFVSAGRDAPVVLHLLPRYASAMSGLPVVDGFDETLAAFRELGYSSLAIDYRGVGASSGSVDTERLAIDARAMWDEALMRSGGRVENVLVRASSLGTLALAALIGEGIRPQAVVLAAPIDSSTIVERAIVRSLGGFLGAVVTPFYRSPPVPPLSEVLSVVDRPVLVLRAGDDDYWSFEDFVRVRSSSSNQVRFLTLDLGHEELVARFYCFEFAEEGAAVVPHLMAEESEFLARFRHDGRPSDASR